MMCRVERGGERAGYARRKVGANIGRAKQKRKSGLSLFCACRVGRRNIAKGKVGLVVKSKAVMEG